MTNTNTLSDFSFAVATTTVIDFRKKAYKGFKMLKDLVYAGDFSVIDYKSFYQDTLDGKDFKFNQVANPPANPNQYSSAILDYRERFAV